MKIGKIDAKLMDKPVRAAQPRALSSAAKARLAAQARLARIVKKLSGPEVVYRITLEAGEKPQTIGRWLLQVAKAGGKEIAVRSTRGGFLVGLMTPERRSRRRGRRPKAA